MYSGFVDYNGLRLSAFSESRLYRLQQKVTRQYGLAKEEYKAAQGQLLLSASAQGKCCEFITKTAKSAHCIALSCLPSH